jgi:hypothetical protein
LVLVVGVWVVVVAVAVVEVEVEEEEEEEEEDVECMVYGVSQMYRTTAVYTVITGSAVQSTVSAVWSTVRVQYE